MASTASNSLRLAPFPPSLSSLPLLSHSPLPLSHPLHPLSSLLNIPRAAPEGGNVCCSLGQKTKRASRYEPLVYDLMMSPRVSWLRQEVNEGHWHRAKACGTAPRRVGIPDTLICRVHRREIVICRPLRDECVENASLGILLVGWRCPRSCVPLLGYGGLGGCELKDTAEGK